MEPYFGGFATTDEEERDQADRKVQDQQDVEDKGSGDAELGGRGGRLVLEARPACSQSLMERLLEKKTSTGKGRVLESSESEDGLAQEPMTTYSELTVH